MSTRARADVPCSKAVPGQDPDLVVVMLLCSVGDDRQRDKIDVLTFGGARSITRKYFSGRVGENTIVSIKTLVILVLQSYSLVHSSHISYT